MLDESKIIDYHLSDSEVDECLNTALTLVKHISDRKDLHPRSYLERYIDIVLGEIAEKMVIGWIRSQGKYAESAVDKTSESPDLGHDIWLTDIKGERRKCSVKSSLSVYKSTKKDILSSFTLASKRSEICAINIQVYFWLDPSSENSRTTTPSNEKAAIIGWLANRDFPGVKEAKFRTEQRPRVEIPLYELRSMKSLLSYIQ